MAPSKRAATVESNNRSSRKKSRHVQATDATSRRATRSMTTDAARTAVFHTSELLEQIILYLPMKNIFGIQRVCRNFRDVIATSPKIQTKMFLRLRIEAPVETWALESLQGSRRPRRRIVDDARFRKVDVKTRSGTTCRPVVLNPLLEVVPSTQHPLSANRLYNTDARREAVVMSLSQSHFGDQPSFLKTYITDPPCYMANAAITANFDFGSTKEDAVPGTVTGDEVKSEQGLTVGDVVLAYTDVHLSWDERGFGGYYSIDSQLEEIIRDTGPFVSGENSSPSLTLKLSGVVVPTDEEWSAVSSEHEEAS